MGSVRASGRCICSPSRGGYHICALFGAEFQLKILKTDLKLMKNMSGRQSSYIYHVRSLWGRWDFIKVPSKVKVDFLPGIGHGLLWFFGWVGLGKL